MRVQEGDQSGLQQESIAQLRNAVYDTLKVSLLTSTERCSNVKAVEKCERFLCICTFFPDWSLISKASRALKKRRCMRMIESQGYESPLSDRFTSVIDIVRKQAFVML